jgi:uncharacterized protein YhaN
MALATALERVEKLRDLEQQQEAARVDLRRAGAAVEETHRVLGVYAPSADAEAVAESSHDVDESEAVLARAIPIEADIDLFAFLRDSTQLAQDRGGLEARLGLLAERQFSDEDKRRLALFRRAVPSLRDWLSAPDPAAPTQVSLWPTRAAFVLGGGIFVALGVLGLLQGRWGVGSTGLIGLGVGLLVAGALARVRHGEGDRIDRRAVAIEKFPESIDPPTSWSREAVTERLRELEDQVAELDAAEKRARDRAVEIGPLEQDLKSLAARDEALETRRRSLAARLGLEPMGPDAEMVDLARALDEARLAQIECRRAEARAHELDDLWRAQLETILAFWNSVGEAHSDDRAVLTDAASARAALRHLAERDRSLRGAIAERAREEKNLERLGHELERLEAERRGIFQRAGIETADRAELVRLASQLEVYRDLKHRCAELAHDIARDRSELEAADAGALALRDCAELEADRARLEARAAGRDEINKTLGEIRGSARMAREGHVLEDAIAKRDALRRELWERREEALAAATGRFLIEGVRREHESNQMPRVLARARDRFGLFTHHRYELNVSPGEGESFVAIDATSGEGLAPDKLSDGTRAQLILAARLAFAEEAEAGADLPLFLDEAMDHSDPERFHAIARSLARMVAGEGRQIFYLSNDPTDFERFEAAFAAEGCQELTRLDLAEIRGRGSRVEGPGALRVAPLPAIPSATGHTAESYGAAIGVTRFEPRRGASDQHVFHLLRDDLDVVEALLRVRIETVGQCENLLKSHDVRADEIRARSEVALQLESRVALLVSFCDAWREGRGSRVGRAEIEASGAVTDKFLEGVVEVAAELAGDARALLDALRERSDPRLSGFRSNKIDDLERYFSEQGALDDRPILDEPALVDRVLGTPAARQLSAKVASELVHQWWSSSQRSTASDDPND